MTESSAESRRVDKRTALSMWDSSTVATGLGKKRVDDDTAGEMKFTVITRRGHKQQVNTASPTATLDSDKTIYPGLSDGNPFFLHPSCACKKLTAPG